MWDFGKKFLVVLVSCFYLHSYSSAQDVLATPNIINAQAWQGCLTQHSGWIWGGTSGGPCPVQRSGDGAILFSYGGSLLYQNIAVNQALSGTGIQVRGWQYAWTIKNANAGSEQTPSWDPLAVRISLYDHTSKNIIEVKNYDYSRRISDWTRFSGTEDFKTAYSLTSLGNLSVTLSSRDEGNWRGYYGPEIQNIDVRLRYSLDPCGSNPLASSTCEGYPQAFLQQQCAISPLYSQQCPGWQQAWFAQQCQQNTLFGPNCPGYVAAYQAQQCQQNPLYLPTCPGYEQAYLTQQCTQNQLFSTACPEYTQAYFNQQCQQNPIYSSGCSGYADATRKKQIADLCQANPQASSQCANIRASTISSTPTVVSLGGEAKDTSTSPTNPLSTTNLANQPAELGTGLNVPGFSPQTPSPQATRRAQAARVARAERAHRDPQTQQQSEQVAQMGTVPGFDQYQQVRLPDVLFYPTREIYRNRTIPDNQRAQRALNQRSDRLHQEMINEQYRN